MNPSLRHLDREPKRLIMIGGKGGVGKTTCASAIALHFSLQGKKDADHLQRPYSFPFGYL